MIDAPAAPFVTLPDRDVSDNHGHDYHRNNGDRWSLTTMIMDLNDIDIAVENEVKNSLTKFFKNFEALKTIDDVCGYNEFFSQYRDMIDSLIVRQYEEMSGVKVKLVRSGQIVKLYPPEIGIKYGKINAESLADSKEFIEEFKVDYTKIPSTCPYKVSSKFWNGISVVT